MKRLTVATRNLSRPIRHASTDVSHGAAFDVFQGGSSTDDIAQLLRFTEKTPYAGRFSTESEPKAVYTALPKKTEKVESVEYFSSPCQTFHDDLHGAPVSCPSSPSRRC